jgi:hypothetical protein
MGDLEVLLLNTLKSSQKIADGFCECPLIQCYVCTLTYFEKALKELS